MIPGVAARAAAARAVGRTIRQGAYANLVIGIEAAGLHAGEHRTAQALAFGVLRHLLRLDWSLAAASDRRLARIQPEVLDALRVAAFELLVSDTPPPVAVSVAVEVVREMGRARAAGFVNAVLRRLAKEGEPAGPQGEEGSALRMGAPLWLYRRLVEAWGRDETEAFLQTSLGEAPVTARLRPGSLIPSGAEPVEGIPGAWVIRGVGLVDEASMVVQDPASVAAVLAMSAGPGTRVLDVAAAPGGKTLHLADLVGPSGTVVAADAHLGRLRRVARRAPGWVRSVAADGTRPPFPPRSFDAVLLDAPCSGLGTLRRRPEIRHRVTSEEVDRLAGLQRRLVDASLPLVRPGGRLVYSVCTVTSEETVAVVAGLEARAPDGLPGRRWGKGLLLGPHLTGTDAMFIAVVSPDS
ncbi:MAG: RsmB/NOP family class I SAM-dependent RNA methyltransferase [Acidimicrobiia bacterium]